MEYMCSVQMHICIRAPSVVDFNKQSYSQMHHTINFLGLLCVVYHLTPCCLMPLSLNAASMLASAVTLLLCLVHATAHCLLFSQL